MLRLNLQVYLSFDSGGLLGKLIHGNVASNPKSRRSRTTTDLAKPKRGNAPARRTGPLKEISGNSSRQRPDAPNGIDPPGAENRHDERPHRPFDIHGEYIEGPIANPPIPNGNPPNGDANPPLPNPVQAAPIKRPRGRPRKNPIANAPQADSNIPPPWVYEASLKPPSTVVSCPRCTTQMPASAAPKHKCKLTSPSQTSSLGKPGGRREGLSVAPKCERQSKGTKRRRSEDEDDANDAEESYPTNLVLTEGAKRRKRDDDGGDGEIEGDGEGEVDGDGNGEDDEDFEEEHVRPSRGAKRVRLYEGDNDNKVIDEDIDRQGPLERFDWANTDPDRFEPHDARLISGYMGTRDANDGEIDGVNWKIGVFI